MKTFQKMKEQCERHKGREGSKRLSGTGEEDAGVSKQTGSGRRDGGGWEEELEQRNEHQQVGGKVTTGMKTREQRQRRLNQVFWC